MLKYFKITVWAQTFGEHFFLYRNCFWHSEQFLCTTCSPRVLQKEELLTKIYLYLCDFLTVVADKADFGITENFCKLVKGPGEEGGGDFCRKINWTSFFFTNFLLKNPLCIAILRYFLNFCVIFWKRFRYLACSASLPLEKFCAAKIRKNHESSKHCCCNTYFLCVKSVAGIFFMFNNCYLHNDAFSFFFVIFILYSIFLEFIASREKVHFWIDLFDTKCNK